MKPSVGDYVLLQVQRGKQDLVRIIKASDGSCKGTLIKEGEDNPAFEFKATEIVANLGHSPRVGDVYGVKIEPLRERLGESSFWGEIRLYVDLDDRQKKRLKKGMQAARDVLERRKLPVVAIDTEIRNPHGKYAGYYKHKPKAEADILCFRPDEEFSNLEYVICHEYGHGIWFRHMTPKQRMSWINMFHDAVILSKVNKKDLANILDGLKTNGDLSSYMKECDEETLRIMRAIVRHIKQVHDLDRKHFELALITGEDVDVYWPSVIEVSEKNVLVSTYAQKSPEELFAESFGLFCSGKKLPKKVGELLDRTLRSLVK
jgi:hypothetical protein